jgi:hypothetical protein
MYFHEPMNVLPLSPLVPKKPQFWATLEPSVPSFCGYLRERRRDGEIERQEREHPCPPTRPRQTHQSTALPRIATELLELRQNASVGARVSLGVGAVNCCWKAPSIVFGVDQHCADEGMVKPRRLSVIGNGPPSVRSLSPYQ